MMKSKAVSASLILGVALSVSATAEDPSPFLPKVDRRALVETEVLVKFKRDTMTRREHRSIIQGRRARSFRTLDADGWVHIRLPAGTSVDSAMTEYSQLPEVESVQPNYRYKKLVAPNDTQYATQWGVKNTAQRIVTATYSTNNPGTAGKDLGLETAWDKITDCSSVTVAVVDTGVNYTHADLAGNMWNGGASYPNHGVNVVNGLTAGPRYLDPMDLDGHGTHVAGIIGAVGNNALGNTGVCWKASIMAVRALDASGSGTSADIVAGLNFAINNGAKIVNMSFGQSSNDAAIEAAIVRGAGQGVIFIAAAGNDGVNNDSGVSPTYPCNNRQPNLICVAALDQSYSLASFSNYGAQSVHVGAPGTNVVSQYAGTNATINDNFNSGGTLNWTRNNTWDYAQRTFGAQSFPMLLNPANWDGRTITYASNLDARVYKSFNLGAVDAAVLDFGVFVDVKSGDFFRIAHHSAGTDPFGGGGTTLDSFTGVSTGTSSAFLPYDISDCVTAQCAVGFQLTSNGATNGFGIGIYSFSITTLTITTDAYRTFNGTSMATPFVAGIAAMIKAYNPNYLYTDVVASVREGGVSAASLTGKTTSGKSASAIGSLNYINPPTGVAAVLQ